MVTEWPKNLPSPDVVAQMLADWIGALSGGRIEVELFAAGELVPGPGVFDAVSEGTADLYLAVPGRSPRASFCSAPSPSASAPTSRWAG